VKTYFTSDTHYNHVNILKYCPGRPYQSIEAMNADFIARWNARVNPEDEVYHLGDFALGKPEDAKPIFDQLRGRKHLILGNHDRSRAAMLGLGFETVQKGTTMYPSGFDWPKPHILLEHHPRTEVYLRSRGYSLQLCGHVHQKWARARTETRIWTDGTSYIHGTPDRQGMVINVGVDVRGFQPATLEELLDGEPPVVIYSGHDRE
jgi:calcineurin-like phosphoesterase family protein